MLSNATVTHSDKDCSFNNGGNSLPVVDGLKKRDDLAQKRCITYYWMVTGVPEHVSHAFQKDHIDEVTQFTTKRSSHIQLSKSRRFNGERYYLCLE